MFDAAAFDTSTSGHETPSRPRVGKTGGPPSYPDILQAIGPVLDAVRELRDHGLSWAAISVMRGVTPTMARLAGCPCVRYKMSTGNGGYLLFSALYERTARLELTYLLSLYSAFDVDRTSDDLLLDPLAFRNTWAAFTHSHPESKIRIGQFWVAARAALQKTITLGCCAKCGMPELRHAATLAPARVNGQPLGASTCVVCADRHDARLLCTNALAAANAAKEAAAEAEFAASGRKDSRRERRSARTVKAEAGTPESAPAVRRRSPRRKEINNDQLFRRRGKVSPMSDGDRVTV